MTNGSSESGKAAGVREVLRARDVRLFWIGETTSGMGSSVTSVALPLVAVVTLHASALEVGVLTAAAWAPWLVIGLPAGAWVDRLPRRPVMVGADAASLLLFVSIPIAHWFGVLTIVQLLGVALLAGVCRVFFQTAYQVYFPGLVEPDQLDSANALVQGSQSATGVAGPGVAGAMTTLFGATSGVLLDAASFLVSALCLRSINASEPPTAKSDESRPLRHEIAAGVQFVAHDRYLRSFALFGGATNFGLIGYQALVVLFLVRDVGINTALIGVLLAATSVGGIIGAASAKTIGQRLGTARGLLICLLVGCPAGLLIPLTQPGAGLAIFVLGSLLLVAAIVASNVLQGSWHPHYCPRSLYGRITSAEQLLNYGTVPLGALLAGTLGNSLGIRPALWIMTAITALAPLTLLATPLRHRHDLPTPPNDRALLIHSS